MKAKKVLTLLNEQNYDELRRLCTLELCTKARKTTTATDKAQRELISAKMRLATIENLQDENNGGKQ